jgi:hydroxypyruvate isomerase
MIFAPNTRTMFQDLALPERLDRFRQHGFDTVEYLFPYDLPAAELKHMLDERGMKISLLDVLPGNVGAGDISAAIDPARIAEFRENARRALEYAFVLDVGFVNCLAGCACDARGSKAILPGDKARLLDLYKENLAFTCDIFRGSGRIILVEPISSFQFPGYLVNRLEEAGAIIDELDRPNLALQFDFFHVQLTQGNLSSNLERFHSRIRYCQIANPPGRNEPGVGELEYDFLLDRLEALGYEGYVGLEYAPSDGMEHDFSWLRKRRAERTPA